MKLFTKLALVSAVAVSGSAMAMESMDDSALSSTTGQDGISIGLGISKIAIESMYIHDKDGLATTATFGGTNLGGKANSGAITITKTGTGANADAGLVITGSGNVTAGGTTVATTGGSTLASGHFADLIIDTDGGTASSTANNSFLNIGAEVSGLQIDIGAIGVADSNVVATDGTTRGIVGTPNTILSGLSLTTGTTKANIQLGNSPQGAMIKLNGSMTGGLKISNLGIVDNGGKGQITIGRIIVSDATSANLTLDATVAVKPQGLEITAGATPTSMYIGDISLSDADYNTGGAMTATTFTTAGSSIGDIEVNNMKVWNGAAGLPTALGGVATPNGAVITVRGH